MYARAMPITLEKVAMFVAYMDFVSPCKNHDQDIHFSREHKLVDEDDATAKFWVR